MILKSFFDSGNQFEAGCDEVGRGCLAGPVVAAAVILPRDFYHPELTDSKLLNAVKRRNLVMEIQKHAISYAIGVCSPREIEEHNILKSSFLAMHKALDKLTTLPDFLLIDGNRFLPYREIKHECIIKGDSKYLSIAAASILAKEYRDDLMKDLSKEFPHYQWEKNKGYPTKAHRQGIAKYGVSDHHRKTFQLLPKQITIFDS